MKFTCSTDALQYAVSCAMPAVAPKPTIPLYSGMYLECNPDGVIIQTSSGTPNIIAKVDATVEEEGTVLVNASRFSQIVKACDSEDVTVKTVGKIIQVKAGRAKFDIHPLEEEGFPVLKKEREDKYWNTFRAVLKGDAVNRLIMQSTFACYKGQERPLFKSVLCKFDGNHVYFIGTNTHRLAIAEYPMLDAIAENESVPDVKELLIPHSLLNIILKVNTKFPEDIEFATRGNRLRIKRGGIVYITTLAEGKFPDVFRTIAPSYASKLKVNRIEMYEAVNRITLCCDEDMEYSIMTLDIKKDEISINSVARSVGTGKEVIDGELEGNEISLAFNTAYLLDFLRMIRSETLTLQLNQPLSPVLITPDETDKDGIQYVLTPIRQVM